MAVVALFMMTAFFLAKWFITGAAIQAHSSETYLWLVIVLTVDFVVLNAMNIAY